MWVTGNQVLEPSSIGFQVHEEEAVLEDHSSWDGNWTQHLLLFFLSPN